MKLSKTSLKVLKIGNNREQAKEGEVEGRLAKVLTLEGGVKLERLAGLFSTPEQHEIVTAMFDEKSGGFAAADLGKIELLTQGRACAVKVVGMISTDRIEFEDSTVDRITLALSDGRMATLRCRVRLHPEVSQMVKVDQWLGNEIVVSINGETVMAGDEDPQDDLDLPEPEDDAETEETEPGSLAESLAEFDADLGQAH